MRLRTLVPVLVLFCALPLVADDSSDAKHRLLARAFESAAKGESAGTIQFNPKEGPQNILSFSWGVSNSGTFRPDGGGGAGKATFQDFNFVKLVDKASPKLMESCAKGQHFANVVVTLRDRKGVESMTITFKEVLISSYSTGGSGGEVAPVESISLNFAHVDIDGILIGL